MWRCTMECYEGFVVQKSLAVTKGEANGLTSRHQTSCCHLGCCSGCPECCSQIVVQTWCIISKGKKKWVALTWQECNRKVQLFSRDMVQTKVETVQCRVTIRANREVTFKWQQPCIFDLLESGAVTQEGSRTRKKNIPNHRCLKMVSGGKRDESAGNRMPKRMHHAAHSVGIRPTVAEGRWWRRGWRVRGVTDSVGIGMCAYEQVN